LLNWGGTALIRYLGDNSRVAISRAITILGQFSFSGCTALKDVIFPTNSALRRIAAGAFTDCSSLRSLFIPSFVNAINGSAFAGPQIRHIMIAPDNPHFRIRCEFLLSRDGTSFVRCFGIDSHIEVFREITILSQNSFGGCRTLLNVSFKGDSELRRIEAGAFSNCSSLHSIFIPSFVDALDRSAFSGAQIRDIIVASDNPHFSGRGPFLLNSGGTSLSRYLGSNSRVEIFREIRAFCQGSFCDCSNLRELSFERNSDLRRIEARAFANCSSLQSIFIPSFVDTIDGSAFCGSQHRQIIVADDNPYFKGRGPFLLNREGTSLIRYFGSRPTIEVFRGITVLSMQCFSGSSALRSVHFECHSELRRIEARAFSDCSSLQSIFIPSFVDTIDGLAFLQSGVRQIIVDEHNPHFKVCGTFLLNRDSLVGKVQNPPG
jgi:hypothetical protein